MRLRQGRTVSPFKEKLVRNFVERSLLRCSLASIRVNTESSGATSALQSKTPGACTPGVSAGESRQASRHRDRLFLLFLQPLLQVVDVLPTLLETGVGKNEIGRAHV